MSTYYEKYLKYKNKYLELKNLMGGQIPTDWKETIDPSSGKPYYYNSVTNETSWSFPSGSAAPSAPSRSAAPSVAAPRSAAPSLSAAPSVASPSVASPSRSAAPSLSATPSVASPSRSAAPSLAPISIPIVSSNSESSPTTPIGSPKVSLPPPNVLPEGWVSQFSKTKGKPYYVNTYTQETQWIIPTEPASNVRTTERKEKIEATDLNKCKLKKGTYVKQIKVDDKYLPTWYKNNPKKADETDVQWQARVQQKVKDWLEVYELGIIHSALKCTDSWKQNIYTVIFPSLNNKGIHVFENEIIPLTEKEYNTILASKNSRVKSIDDKFTHFIVNERTLPPN